ncbi:MAG: dTDP-4-dehydrorhamnose reductase [Candidatus Magasanikbacteria bacterium GW2011_GWC2_37_14]|uniref:dTDP-4-dehydrorhamnose reductase n=1 Tax=Candidatus Magasanikbacteria bacterium GW2011_GWC2_37_14 TaxID=1619046 RepID=A0A0G0IT07_9BACT|nr:MAG: dTDP-4-dehydrorhamnose reductase [Candidatus Magasanikbacteria bacterium GW2011_GWC2_37_14]
MRIVITGAKGMLGQALQTEFKDCEVFAYDKEELDITDKNKIKIKLTEIKPDVLINATAYNAVDKIEENSADFKIAELVNGQAVGYLAESCKNLDIILVHYSSDYVFKGDRKSGYTEEAYNDPINKYGQSKVLGEQLLKMGTVKYYLIRLSRLFGPAGASEMAKKSFVDIMLDLVKGNPSAGVQGKQELDLVDDEKTCPTYVKDLAKFTRELLEQKKPHGIYHGANSGACTWYQFAEEIFKLKNLQVKCNPVSADKFPRPAKRPNFSELLNTKMPKQRSWQEALQEYLK